MLLAAHARVPGPRPLLILPGYRTGQDAELEARLAQLGTADDVRLLGWVDDDELEGLYAAAACSCSPRSTRASAPGRRSDAARIARRLLQGGSLAEIAGEAAESVRTHAISGYHRRWRACSPTSRCATG